MIRTRCECSDAIFEHLGNWDISFIVAEYGYQFSLDTYEELMDNACFGVSGSTKPGVRACVIKGVAKGPKALTEPYACLDFWPMSVRILHFSGIEDTAINPRLGVDWYESIKSLLGRDARVETWRMLDELRMSPPREWIELCDFVLSELETWLYDGSKRLVCPYETQKMPSGQPPPHMSAIR